MPTDPEVAACLARHTTAPVDHCADCGICQDCDVTLGAQETPDQDRCESCATAADDRRGEQNQLWPYTAAGAPYSR